MILTNYEMLDWWIGGFVGWGIGGLTDLMIDVLVDKYEMILIL